MSTTIPNIVLRPYIESPLSEQAMYDFRNIERKGNALNDFDDEEEEEDDYINDNDDVDSEEESATTTTTTVKSITITSATTSDVTYNSLLSSSSRFTLKSINLLLLFLSLIQKYI